MRGKPSGLGIGLFIMKIETFAISTLKNMIKNILIYFSQKYNLTLNFLINHFGSSNNIKFYSKFVILFSILIFLCRLIKSKFKKKKQFINKTDTFFGVFANSCLSEFNTSISIVNRNAYIEKIEKLIIARKKQMEGYENTVDNINSPFFKLMKFYLKYIN